MKTPFKQLHFYLHHDHPTKSYSVGVVLDGQEIYRIKDFVHLTQSLGLVGANKTPEDLQNLIENHSDFFPTAECFQSKITQYVFENCAQFRESYNAYFASLIGSCEFDGKANNINCKHCFRNPNSVSA